MLIQLLWVAGRVSRIVSLLIAIAVVAVAIRWLVMGGDWRRLAAIPGVWVGVLWSATLLPFICLAVVAGLLQGFWLLPSAAAPPAAPWLGLAITLSPLLVTIGVTAAWVASRRANRGL